MIYTEPDTQHDEAKVICYKKLKRNTLKEFLHGISDEERKKLLETVKSEINLENFDFEHIHIDRKIYQPLLRISYYVIALR